MERPPAANVGILVHCSANACRNVAGCGRPDLGVPAAFPVTVQTVVLKMVPYTSSNESKWSRCVPVYPSALSKALEPDGIAIFNIIANPWLQDAYSKRIDNTIRGAFANCMSSPENYGVKRTNIIYTCNKTSHAYAADIYTDDLN